MARKPTPAEVQERKSALLSFMHDNQLTTQDVCDLINEASIRPTSLRTVQSWVAAMDAPASRTPPDGIAEKLDGLLEQRRKAQRPRRRA